MSDKRNRRVREAFQKPTPVLVKVTPKGFLIDDEIVATLKGRIVKTVLLRKLFEDGFLVCDSQDGIRSRSGIVCDECRHPKCRPQVRLHLADLPTIHIIDLAFTSARNLFALEDQAARAEVEIADWPIELSVTDHGTWGEIHFTRT